MIITSRPSTSEDCVTIIQDYIVNPPELRIDHDSGSTQQTLLIKSVDDKITLYDLIRILNKLNVKVLYEELV